MPSRILMKYHIGCSVFLTKYSAAICCVKSQNLQDCTVRLGKKNNSVSLTLFLDGVIRKSEPADGMG